MSKALLLFTLLLSALCLSSETHAQTLEGCPIFPADNPWNVDISEYPVHPLSDLYISRINESSDPKRQRLHPDFGSPREYGIPFVVVDATQPMVAINYTDYGDESDPGPMPIPPNAPVEGGEDADGDRHVLVIDKSTCRLYELYNAHPRNDNGWDASSGAIFDLEKNEYRSDGWTSADAAGLPIFPGLVRYDEVKAGEIKHALRFTVPRTQPGWIHPARHKAATTQDTTYPPMGLRLRLKQDYDISGHTPDVQVILVALKKYGMLLADNGSPWFISGATDPRWDDDAIGNLKSVPGSAFEAVYTGPIKREPEATIEAPSSNRVRAERSESGWVHSGYASEGFAEVYDIAGKSLLKIDLRRSSKVEIPSDLSHGILFVRIGGQTIKLL